MVAFSEVKSFNENRSTKFHFSNKSADENLVNKRSAEEQLSIMQAVFLGMLYTSVFKLTLLRSFGDNNRMLRTTSIKKKDVSV